MNEISISLLIRGQSLPMAALSKDFCRTPFVMRGPNRKLIESIDDSEVTYTSFMFPEYTKTTARELIEAVTVDFFGAFERIASRPEVSFKQFHVVLQLDQQFKENWTCALVRRLSDLKVSIWFDCYFKDAPEVVRPPDGLIVSAPAGTAWFGGLIDEMYLMVLPAEADWNIDPNAPGASELKRVDLYELDKEIDLMIEKIKSDEDGDSKLLCLGRSYRTNRSVEIPSSTLSTLATHQYGLAFDVAHVV